MLASDFAYKFYHCGT